MAAYNEIADNLHLLSSGELLNLKTGIDIFARISKKLRLPQSTDFMELEQGCDERLGSLLVCIIFPIAVLAFFNDYNDRVNFLAIHVQLWATASRIRTRRRIWCRV